VKETGISRGVGRDRRQELAEEWVEIGGRNQQRSGWR